jgi:hypothetical protein
MSFGRERAGSGLGERGQAAILLIGVMFLLLVGAVVLFAFGSALGLGASISGGGSRPARRSSRASDRSRWSAPACCWQPPACCWQRAGSCCSPRSGVDSTYAAHVLSGLLVIGLGLASATAMGTAALGVRPDDAGVASATVNTMQQNGGSIGPALLSTLAASATSSYAASHATATDAMAQAAAHGYTTAFWWSAAIFAAGAIVSGLPNPARDAASRPGRRARPRPQTLHTPGLASGRGRRRVRSQELLRTCGAIARTRKHRRTRSWRPGTRSSPLPVLELWKSRCLAPC